MSSRNLLKQFDYRIHVFLSKYDAGPALSDQSCRLSLREKAYNGLFGRKVSKKL
jgi:hypothetical protein